MPETTTAFIAIVGCPNVGKSSLLNKVLGTKIAIVSSKPQTTRTKIMGVLTRGACQLVFTDTPGYHRPKNKLGDHMVKAVTDSIGGVDACLFVTEAEGNVKPGETELIEKFKKLGVPVVLAVNKVDTLPDKKSLGERIALFSSMYDFEAVVPVSAVKGTGVDELLGELEKLAQPSPHFFPDDTLTDQPERVIAAEI
ncbi:MAG: GTPase Era, partial [Clostridia bacterium]|nr:GTPase Era [Clostridia bacterium]